MALGNKPSFLQGIDAEGEEKEVLDVLQDPTSEDENPTDDDTADVETDTEEETSEEETETSEEESDSEEGDKSDTEDDVTADKATQNKDEKDPNKEVTSEEVEEKIKKFSWGNFKTPEEAEKAYKELQRTLTRLNTQLRTKETGDTKKSQEDLTQVDKLVEMAKNTPLFDVSIPDAKNYQLENGFDISGYMRDFSKNIIMSFQKSMVGELGSIQFGMMQQAMNEEFGAVQAAETLEQSSKAIESKLYEDFPALKTDEAAQRLFERAVYGEGARRKMEAEKEGKKPEPMNEEDFLTIAKDVLGSLKIDIEPQKQDEADKPTIGTPASPDKVKTKTDPSGLGDDEIDAMMKSKARSGSIF